MTDIMFSNYYSYGANSLSGAGFKNWDEQRGVFGKKFLELFSKNDENDKIRAFWCKHIAWDLFNEYPFSGNKILCCIDNKKIVAVWSSTDRFYSQYPSQQF